MQGESQDPRNRSRLSGQHPGRYRLELLVATALLSTSQQKPAPAARRRRHQPQHGELPLQTVPSTRGRRRTCLPFAGDRRRAHRQVVIVIVVELDVSGFDRSPRFYDLQYLERPLTALIVGPQSTPTIVPKAIPHNAALRITVGRGHIDSRGGRQRDRCRPEKTHMGSESESHCHSKQRTMFLPRMLQRASADIRRKAA